MGGENTGGPKKLPLKVVSHRRRSRTIKGTNVNAPAGRQSPGARPNGVTPLSDSESTTKHCARCDETKSIEAFGRDRSRKDGRYPYCKKCASQRQIGQREKRKDALKVYSKNYREKNLERIRANDRDYYLNNSEKIKKRARDWRDANPDRVQAQREAFAGKAAQYQREWHARNPCASRERDAKRRALKAGAGGSHTRADILAMYEDQNGLCAFCEIPLHGVYHVDHLIPLVRGGPNDWTNLAICCQTCNNRKYTKTAEEFWEYLKRLNLTTV